VQIGRGTAAKAVVFHYTGGAWRVDRSGQPKLTILAPHPGSVDNAITQVAITMKAKTPLVQSALWVDGVELQEKGGGLTPTNGTIYGAPALALAKGVHTVVGYARTAGHGSAVAWSYTVR
jgi:hypothetical protein